MPSLNITWCLELWGKSLTKSQFEKHDAFIMEFDCELGVDYWGEPGHWGCELDSVTVESGPSRRIITKKSDPELWVLMERAFQADDRLEDKIANLIAQHASDSLYEYRREAAE